MQSFRNRLLSLFGLSRDARGSVLLEFAFVLPIFALLLFAVIEFGWYFIRFEAVNRALSLTTESIQQGVALTQTQANANGAGLISFGTGGSYVCAQTFQNSANASAANPGCQNGVWALGTAMPTCSDTNSTCTTPYYVDVIVHAGPASLTGLVSMILPHGTSITLPANQPSFVVMVGAAGAAASASSGTIAGGCYMVASADAADYDTQAAFYAAWGNASTPFPLPASDVNASKAPAYSVSDWDGARTDINACTCPSGYTSRVVGQTVGGSPHQNNSKYITQSGSGGGPWRYSFDTTFVCVAN